MTTTDQINGILRGLTELAEKATPEWWHCHPMGGNEIYADSVSHEPIAKFLLAADCDIAIASRAAIPALVEAIGKVVGPLHDAIISNRPISPVEASGAVASILSTLRGIKDK